MTTLDIFIGTVFGGAEGVAEELKQKFVENGYTVNLHNPGQVSDIQNSSNIIICTSTTGCGDIPDELNELFYNLKQTFPLISDKTFAVIGLGDSSYGATFCNAGYQFDCLLEELTGNRVLEYFRIDAMETFEPEEEALKWAQEYMKKVPSE